MIEKADILIIGGGNIGFSLAELIEKNDDGISTELIELDKQQIIDIKK